MTILSSLSTFVRLSEDLKAKSMLPAADGRQCAEALQLALGIDARI